MSLQHKTPFLLLTLGVFLALTLPRLHSTMGQDEISHYYKLIRLLYEQNAASPETLITFSPHGYPLCAVTLCKILGTVSPVAIKLTGILFWCLTLFILCWRCSNPLLPLLLATLPAACQSAVIVEIDQAVLPLISLLLCLAFLYAIENRGFSSWLGAAGMFGLSLWFRLTTPLLLCAPILLFAFLQPSSFLNKRLSQCLFCFSAMLVGFFLFLLSWFLYCHWFHIHFAGPFEYLVASFQQTTTGTRASTPSRILQSAIYLHLWGMSLPLFLLFSGKFPAVFKELTPSLTSLQKPPASGACLFWLCAFSLLTGYLVIGGSLFGFPKYQMPAFPLLMLALDTQSHSLPRIRWQWFLLLLLPALLTLLLPDMLYLLRVSLKEELLFHLGQKNRLIALLLGQFLLLNLLSAGLFLTLIRKPRLTWETALLLIGIALNTGFSLKQDAVPYATGYIYGEGGEFQRIADYVMRHHLQTPFIPAEITHLTGQLDTAGALPADYDSPEKILSKLTATTPAVFAASFLINPLPQMQEILSHPQLQEYLNIHYRKYPLPHVTLFIRNDLPDLQ